MPKGMPYNKTPAPKGSTKVPAKTASPKGKGGSKSGGGKSRKY